MKISPAEHHQTIRQPYYIFAPDFRESSSGIRVLHYLCHILNLNGHEAYIQAGTVAEGLWTPQLDAKVMERHYLGRRKPIVIYPEVVHGTPLGLGIKVRWLLNKAGFIAGHAAFDPDELLIAYREAFVGDADVEQLLTVPCSDPNLFNPGLPRTERQGRYFYYNRLLARGGSLLPATEGAIEISPAKPRTLQELAEIFKRAELLYCYEDGAITLEARMCGCPVVYVPNPTMLPRFPEEDWGRMGAAWGTSDEEIRHAQATVGDVFPAALKLYETFSGQLKQFIERTQAAARDTDFDACYPLETIRRHGWKIHTAPDAPGPRKHARSKVDVSYQSWLKRTSLQEIDGQLLAERMLGKWTQRPLINIVIEGRVGEENLVADSIDSIATQWYPDWHLTLVTEFPPADPALAELEQVTWVVRQPDDDPKSVMDATLDRTPGTHLLLMEPGNTIEAHALAYFADTINHAPTSRLIYCDEDVRSASGEQTGPRFKPDFNLELLRNMYYCGPALVVEKNAFEAIGGWSRHPDAALYDLTLRVLDHFGGDSITHQRDMLLHTPESSLRPINAEAEQGALREHFDRNRLRTEVQTGFLEGTQKVTYQLTSAPLVSIIIPTRDQPGYLAHCVDSLLTETTYRNWELILADHGTRDPDGLDYIAQLTGRRDLAHPARSVRTDGEFNYARLCNLGAAQARGDYLLFLDNDTEIIQPSWLENLLAYFEQGQVAAVAPRLSKPEGKFPTVDSGPRILGLASMAGGIADKETSMLEPGYCGRLQVAQDVSALSGSCFMVRAALFRQHGGFNETDTPIYEPTLDLCLKLRRAGQRLIWTPWVDVVHHGGITKLREESDAAKRVRLAETALLERDFIYHNHLPQLADDPFYHRQLSLNTPFAVDPHAVIDWDPRFHDRLRILGLPLTSGSGEYRMVSPFRALQKTGIAQTCIVHPVKHKVQRVLNPVELARARPDVLMLQQAIDDTQIGQLKRYRRFNPEIFITYAVDDVLGNLPRKHYLYNYQAREGKSRMREGLAHCDRLVASTEPIAEYCRSMIDDIVVVPNRLEGAFWLGHQSRRGAGRKPRVGWAGAQQHLGDLEMITEVVEALRSEVDWVFMGMCPDFLKPHVAEEHPFVSFTDYPAKLASLNLDLAIAPLEQHLFNEGKSNLRLLEYGVMGWPVVCTDIYPYQTNNAPVKRVPNTASAWIEAIRERINDLDSAYKEGDALRAWVMRHYILEDHAAEWLKALTPTGKPI